MNPVDHYTAVGYTHRDIAQALLNPLVSIPVDAEPSEVEQTDGLNPETSYVY